MHLRRNLLLLFCLFNQVLSANAKKLPVDSLYKTRDMQDVINSLFKRKSYNDTAGSHSNLSLLPSIGYNPSYGLEFGIIVSGGKNYGDPANTTFSIFNTNVFVSTNGLASAEFKHNTFSSHNTWNLQGGYQVGRTVALDYGIGTGHSHQSNDNFVLNGLPLDNSPGVLPKRPIINCLIIFTPAWESLLMDIRILINQKGGRQKDEAIMPGTA
jgi:hypothetical protein